jgi:hypothetical protein
MWAVLHNRVAVVSFHYNCDASTEDCLGNTVMQQCNTIKRFYFASACSYVHAYALKGIDTIRELLNECDNL